jgi:inorganic phosphate transporter, PiT family
MLEHLTPLLVLVIIIALAFDYVNGFHDAANAIATVVSTRALTPRAALMMAGILNFAGAFASTEVAKTVGDGLVEKAQVGQLQVVLAALVGALLWNLLTWWLGLPSSSSHALVGGLIGSVCFHTQSLTSGIKWSGVVSKVVIPSLVAPVVALVCGFTLMLTFTWLLHLLKPTPALVNRRLKVFQKISAAIMAFSHGAADAQKVMGVIALALVTAGVQKEFYIATWVKASCALMIALGTSAGGWKIIRTMGGKIFKMQPVHGFAADMTSASVLLVSAHMGMPLSTTHVLTGSIMGVGASKRISAVRWGVAKKILAAWVFTIPASACVGAATCWLVTRF